MKAIHLLLLLAPFSLTAQAQADTSPKKLLGSHAEKFHMDPPDSSFSDISNGYENEAGATVVYQVLPVAYSRMLSDMQNDPGSATDSFVFRKPMVLDKLSGYLVKMLYKSPDSGFEDLYGLMFVCSYQEETIHITAVYPVSQDRTLYPKMLHTFATLRHVEP
jgi:hypothetical protein